MDYASSTSMGGRNIESFAVVTDADKGAFGVVSFTYREDAIAAMRVECMCVWVAISMTLN